MSQSSEHRRIIGRGHVNFNWTMQGYKPDLIADLTLIHAAHIDPSEINEAYLSEDHATLDALRLRFAAWCNRANMGFCFESPPAEDGPRFAYLSRAARQRLETRNA